MSFGGAPKEEREDPKAQQDKLDTEATQKANAEKAAKRKGARANSLLATGAQGVTSDAATATSSTLAYGKNQLGA